MQINISANANLKQAQAQFAILEKQVESLNAAMAQTSMIPMGGTPAGFNKVSRAVAGTTHAYSTALAASGAYRVEQLKMTDIIDEQTRALQKQKLSFREVWGRDGRRQMRAVYREQLAMQQAVSRSMDGAVSDGRLRNTFAIPTEVHKSWDNLNNRVGMFRYELASASGALVNWGKNTQWAGRQLMVGISMPIAAFGAAAGVMAYRVDKEMTRIQKVYDTTADANATSVEAQIAVQKELDALRESAMDTAKQSAHEYGTAVEDTLQVQAELAAVGLKNKELQESTAEVTRIAMLGEIDHAVATQALISMQSVLGSTARETGDAFNYMNAIENATSLTTQDFAAAIPRALGPMKQMSAEGATANEVLQNTSLLMVAMKERGIAAGEGANAIKAMMQRLYRPSVKVREEWQEIANIDPLAFVKQSGGDVMKMLPLIANSLEGLKKHERTKLLAGLFGTYQVARMNAMLEGINDINKAGTQTARVLEVNREGAEAWADTAVREQKRVAESAAGQFTRALQGLRAELADIGEPFLKVASTFLKVFTKGAELFNSMPEWAKKTAILVAILAAFVGPVVMLVGLFANFAGNIGKFAASSLRLVSSFELLNKKQYAARAASALAEKGFISEAEKSMILKRQLDALTLAADQSAIAMSKLAGTSLPPSLATKAANLAPGVNLGTYAKGTGAGTMMGMPGGLASTRMPHRTTAAGGQAAAEYAERAAAAERQRMSAAVGTAHANEKTNKFAHGAAVSTAAMAASMGLMMFTSNEVANNIGTFLMVAAIAVPAIKGLAPVMALAGAKSLVVAKGVSEVAKKAAIAGGSVAGWKAGIGGAARGFAGLMGPIGWITLGVAAVGTGIFAWHNHLKKIREEQARLHNDVNNLGNAWAEQAGRVEKKWKNVSVAIAHAGDAAKQATLTEQYSSGEMKNEVGAFKEISRDDELAQTRYLREHFMELQVDYGLTPQEAAQNIRALLQVAGAGIEEQNKAVKDVLYNVGKITDENFAKYLTNQIEIMNDKAFGTEEWKVSGEGVGHAFLRGFHDGVSRENLVGLVDQVGGEIENQWRRVTDTMLAQGGDAFSDALGEIGIHGAAALTDALMESGDVATFLHQLREKTGYIGDPRATAVWRELSDGAVAAEEVIIKSITNSDNGVGKFIDNSIVRFKDFAKDISIAAHTMNLEEAQEAIEGMYSAITNGPTTMPIVDVLNGLKTSDPDKWEEFATAINTLADSNGIKRGANIVETYLNILNGVRVSAKGAEGDVGKVGKKVDGLPDKKTISVEFKGEDYNSILRSGMEAVQSQMADSAMDSFNDSMESALESSEKGWDNTIDRAQAAWDRRLESQQARHERQQEAFDNRWERRRDAIDKYYDGRVKAVDGAIKAEQKAEEIRQRIFEAEKTRLQRLADMANQTIDFNMSLRTGDLDEAAKIRNDMDATVSEWALSDAGDKGSTSSERRVERLEGRRDAIEEQRERELKVIEKREEQERKHLERVQKMREDALKAASESNLKALRSQADSDIDAQRRRWESERDSLEDRLDLFKSYTARGQKDLERWMKQVGMSYDDFGDATKKKGTRWSEHFRNELSKHVRQAANKIRGDKMWESMGRGIARQTLMGLGFGNMAEFKNFIKTGKLPKPQKGKSKDSGANGTRASNIDANLTPQIPRHTGGWLDSSAGSRKGVARNLKGTHPNEVSVLAQKGEFMVNRDSAAKNAGILEAINSGANFSKSNRGRGVGGPRKGVAAGIAGMVSAFVARGLATGASKAMTNEYESAVVRRAAMSAVSGSYAAGKGGMFSDRTFGAEQLKNAATIANVGAGMGMSARDIMIGIMTAITESGLINVNHGDRDSLGLFQQRPSQGWGSPEQVTNPEYAARKFFEGLKGVSDRGSMEPWLAAQAVQRSFDSTGSNYRQYWDNAQAIYKSGLVKDAATGMLVVGSGGWNKPSIAGKGWSNSHDYRNGIGSPLYAHADSTVVKSAATTSGGSAGNGLYSTPYRSYGEVIKLRGPDGNVVTYAHLSPGARYVRAGQRVKGGSLIGLSGNTGNSSGPHTHFDINGNYNAREWFSSHGIGLKAGGYTMSDGMANLHKDEVVVDPVRTRKLFEGIDNFAMGGGNQYNVDVTITEPGASADEITRKVITALKREEARKPLRRH